MVNARGFKYKLNQPEGYGILEQYKGLSRRVVLEGSMSYSCLQSQLQPVHNVLWRANWHLLLQGKPDNLSLGFSTHKQHQELSKLFGFKNNLMLCFGRINK